MLSCPAGLKRDVLARACFVDSLAVASSGFGFRVRRKRTVGSIVRLPNRFSQALLGLESFRVNARWLMWLPAVGGPSGHLAVRGLRRPVSDPSGKGFGAIGTGGAVAKLDPVCVRRQLRG